MISVDSNDSLPDKRDDDAKPLIVLFKRLIDNKQSMVLTNAQILNILQKEFEMELSYIHELEKEMYLQFMKKFLNDWPRWDEFDQSASTFKNDESTRTEKLMHYYNDLKTYLRQKLNEVKHPIQEAIKDVPNRKEVANYDKDVVLEIRCTRPQLNELIFRRPHPDYNNTIFNIQGAPTKITVFGSRTMASVINWPGMSITVNVKHMQLKRTWNSILKHRLINKKLNQSKPVPEILNTNIQMKDVKAAYEYDKDEFLNCLNSVNSFMNENEKLIFQALSETITKDLNTVPNLPLPALLRRTVSKYPYVRYLFSEVITFNSEPSNSNLYDLQLEETIIPQWHLSMKYDAKLWNPLEISMHCGECDISFPGENALEHFDEMHQGEPYWMCTNCDMTFDALDLSHSEWQHDCSLYKSNK